MIVKVLLFLLLVVMSALHVVERLRDGVTIKKVLKLVVSPGIFPLLLFAYGYFFYSSPFIPTFVTWKVDLAYLAGLSIYLTLILILQPVIVNQKYETVAKKLKKGDITRTDGANLITLSLNDAFSASFSAGVFEELWFRFVAITAFLPLMYFLSQVVSLSLISDLIPGWLILWAGSITSVPILLAAFLSNLIFAYLHLIDLGDSKTLTSKNWFRPFLVWFPGWIYFGLTITSGILWAILAHFLIDFIGMTWGLYLINRRLQDDIRMGRFDHIYSQTPNDLG